jgi:hypothetical protein
MDGVPEPFLPNQLDVGLTLLVKLLSILHLLRLFITRTQQMSNLDRTLDVPDKYPLVISDISVYLFLPVCIIDTRDRNYELGEYGESME